jgi:hypothetical protein
MRKKHCFALIAVAWPLVCAPTSARASDEVRSARDAFVVSGESVVRQALQPSMQASGLAELGSAEPGALLLAAVSAPLSAEPPARMIRSMARGNRPEGRRRAPSLTKIQTQFMNTRAITFSG